MDAPVTDLALDNRRSQTYVQRTFTISGYESRSATNVESIQIFGEDTFHPKRLLRVG